MEWAEQEMKKLRAKLGNWLGLSGLIIFGAGLMSMVEGHALWGMFLLMFALVEWIVQLQE